MLQSRAVLLARILANPLRARVAAGQQQAVRNSGAWNYRKPIDWMAHPAWVRHGSLLTGGLMWWWVLWHLWHEPEHITGEFPEPDPLLWTDKELGIPPDDFDEE